MHFSYIFAITNYVCLNLLSEQKWWVSYPPNLIKSQLINFYALFFLCVFWNADLPAILVSFENISKNNTRWQVEQGGNQDP